MAKRTYRCDWIEALEIGRLSCIIWMGPKCNHKGPCMQEPRRSKEEVGEIIMKARGYRNERMEAWPRKARILHKLEKSKKQIFPKSLRKEPSLPTL